MITRIRKTIPQIYLRNQQFTIRGILLTIREISAAERAERATRRGYVMLEYAIVVTAVIAGMALLATHAGCQSANIADRALHVIP